MKRLLSKVSSFLLSQQKKRIIFGLGSNLGDRDFYLKEAVKNLTQQLSLKNTCQSKIFKNPAMLMPNSPSDWNCEFFNIAFSGDINLKKFPPLKILEITQKIEKNLGRQERQRWAPREIDIDILAIENTKIQLDTKLIIPHYDLLNRDFFLKTIAEIEPKFLQKLTKI